VAVGVSGPAVSGTTAPSAKTAPSVGLVSATVGGMKEPVVNRVVGLATTLVSSPAVAYHSYVVFGFRPGHARLACVPDATLAFVPRATNGAAGVNMA